MDSDTTKDRFASMYRIPDKGSARSGAFFNAAVLELVKLIQAALAIFGMFDPSPEERNGLLCDVTCDGIKRWVTEVGELCVRVEVSSAVSCILRQYDYVFVSLWRGSPIPRS